MIKIKLEPKEMQEWTHTIENCYFCKSPTQFWHEKTNNPVCPSCSKIYNEEDLPNRFKRDVRKLDK
jgi:hypothetical protein